MNNLDYSIVIRTLGTSGEKFVRLLDSVNRQTIQPKEIVVVIAEGYTPPDSLSHVNNCRLVYTKKGMVNQRQVGFEQANFPYLLVLDDDIAFEAEFVEQMHKRLLETKSDCIFPKTKGGNNMCKWQIVKYYFLGQRRYSSTKNPFFLRIGATGGTIWNTNIKETDLHWCQTANFQCFYIKRDIALSAHLEEEMWLEDTGYALPDDQVFFYKVYLNGGKTLFTPDIEYSHLDAKSGNNKVDKVYRDYYTVQRNFFIFWYRFLWQQEKDMFKQIILLGCILYRIFAQLLFFMLKSLIKGNFKNLFKCHKPIVDTCKFINKL